MQNETLFTESQKFNQWWLYIILILASLILAAAVIFTVLSKLETQIKKDGVYVRFYPAHRKFKYYPWSEISKAYVRQYSPLGEYGGWGLKGFSDNKALNISGKTGFQLELKNGKKLLIGTQKPEEIKELLTRLNVSQGTGY